MSDLSRLFRPKSIAVIGGGAWCTAIVEQCAKIGFEGPVWPVYPKADQLAGVDTFRTLGDLPGAPDACFIGVNRNATVNLVGQLSTMGAGGAVCFASGFLEAEAEDDDAAGLQQELLAAAGEMPILGPNCYGFVNYLDRALLWPDQHGGAPCDSGVAIITQSSNIAINLTMQTRGLPLAYVVTAGNQAQQSIADIGKNLIADPRVTVLGLHIEGFKDLRGFEELARQASVLGKRIVALKVGKSHQAQKATISHTASLAGGDAGASALLARLGIARLETLPDFLETLKLLHICGPLSHNTVASVSCSGGEASLAADISTRFYVTFPALNSRQEADLRAALGPMVALANPLDYHTYIWRDADAMTRAWSAIVDPTIGLTMLIIDYPLSDRADDSDWECATEAALRVRAETGGKVAVVATLQELLPEKVASRLLAGGVVPICGLREAFAAVQAASVKQPDPSKPLLLASASSAASILSEAQAKAELAGYGLRVPKSNRASTPAMAASIAHEIGFPVVLKGEGFAHKTEAGAVALGLSNPDAVMKAATTMQADGYLVEEMIGDNIAELLIGVTRDPAHGYVLTLAAGGVLTELLADSQSLLIPTHRTTVLAALQRLKIWQLALGYRGKPPANIDAIVDAIMAVQMYVVENADGLEEVEVNPLICGANKAVAADALIRRGLKN
jgi:acyl-CoA synthetase (NDP forming)